MSFLPRATALLFVSLLPAVPAAGAQDPLPELVIDQQVDGAIDEGAV